GADVQAALEQHTMMQVVPTLLLGIGDQETAAIHVQIAGVAHLAARLAIKRRAVKHHDAALLGLERHQCISLAIDDGSHRGTVFERVVAGKGSLALKLERCAVIGAELAGSTGTLALCLEFTLETGL